MDTPVSAALVLSMAMAELIPVTLVATLSAVGDLVTPDVASAIIDDITGCGGIQSAMLLGCSALAAIGGGVTWKFGASQGGVGQQPKVSTVVDPSERNEEIHIKTALSGRWVQSIPFAAESSVRSVKVSIWDQGGTHLWAMDLVFDGTVLADSLTLRQCGIVAGDTIDLVRKEQRLAVSCAFDRSMRIWDPSTGVCKQVFQEEGSSPLAVAVNLPEMKALVGYNHGKLRLLDLTDGSCVQQFHGHQAGIVALDADFTLWMAVTGAMDNSLRLWDVLWDVDFGGPVACLATLVGHERGVLAVAVGWSSMRAASVSLDATTRIWDLNSGRCLQVLRPARVCQFLAVCADWAHDTLATGSDDGVIRFWELPSEHHFRELRGHTRMVLALSVDWPTDRAVSASGDKTLLVWNIRRGEMMCKLEGHTDIVWSLSVAWDEGLVVSASHDQTIRSWSLSSVECQCVLTGHQKSARFVTLA